MNINDFVLVILPLFFTGIIKSSLDRVIKVKKGLKSIINPLSLRDSVQFNADKLKNMKPQIDKYLHLKNEYFFYYTNTIERKYFWLFFVFIIFLPSLMEVFRNDLDINLNNFILFVLELIPWCFSIYCIYTIYYSYFIDPKKLENLKYLLTEYENSPELLLRGANFQIHLDLNEENNYKDIYLRSNYKLRGFHMWLLIKNQNNEVIHNEYITIDNKNKFKSDFFNNIQRFYTKITSINTKQNHDSLEFEVFLFYPINKPSSPLFYKGRLGTLKVNLNIDTNIHFTGNNLNFNSIEFFYIEDGKHEKYKKYKELFKEAKSRPKKIKII